jgi:hypothetical protein
MGAFDDLIEQERAKAINIAPVDASAEAPETEKVPHSKTGMFDDLILQAQGKKTKPDRGQLETFLRAAAQGASFNLADELAGAHAAGPAWLPEALGPLPLRTMVGGVRAALDPEAYKQYEKARDEFRTAVQQGAEQHPVTSAAGNVTGALGSAALIPGGAATLPLRARAGISAAIGAGSGALSGAGEGETLGERATGALKGGVLGGAIGGAAPPLIEAAGAAISPIASRIASMARGYRDPELEAARRVATTINRDIAVDPQATSRLTNQEAAQSMQAGGPAMMMDLGGETTRALARSAANQSPEGRAILEQFIQDRYRGQTGRVANWLRDTFNYPDAAAQSEALAQTARTVNKPAYGKAYSEGANLPFNETLEQITQAPEVQGAIRKAMINAKSEAAKMGFTPPKNPFQFDETGRLKLMSNPDGSSMTPNLQFWDIVKRNLDQGDRNSQSWSKILRDHLDELVPSYGDARAGAAHFFDADNALQAGQNFVSKNMTSGDARQALGKMSDQEKQLFQDGFVSKYIDTLQQVGDSRNVLNKIAESPAAREKLNIALGRDKADQLEANLRVEGIMDLARRALGNSTTVRQWTELGLAGTAGYGLSGGGINPFESPGAVVAGLLTAGGRYGGQKIEGNVARKIADLLVSRNPNDLKRGIDIIRKNSRLMNMLRSTDKYIARVGGEEASGTGGQPVGAPSVTPAAGAPGAAPVPVVPSRPSVRGVIVRPDEIGHLGTRG